MRARRKMGSGDQEDDCMSYRKPWDAEGISRATWYRRHRETAVAETAETVRQIGETETGETVRQTAETVETAETDEGGR